MSLYPARDIDPDSDAPVEERVWDCLQSTQDPRITSQDKLSLNEFVEVRYTTNRSTHASRCTVPPTNTLSYPVARENLYPPGSLSGQYQTLSVYARWRPECTASSQNLTCTAARTPPIANGEKFLRGPRPFNSQALLVPRILSVTSNIQRVYVRDQLSTIKLANGLKVDVELPIFPA
ncbi:hypothetical protein JAAARDRAFT_59763 [Jaapia argillacea MUCL 33604]|uniref:Uncharacterized protein n=1 Tax=Jaapia argillacea MUCL 33604 TaxID=933084 RepID=A0A067PPR0_9AGAM|nr:hypothetical protein JAAARDRAFT_59763 [Jaapia argillacea MUCL 33604]